MKTIEQAANEYAGINDDKNSNSAKVYDKYDLAIAFISGTGFAQRWISVEDELPEIKDKSYQIIVSCQPTQSGTVVYRIIAIFSFETDITIKAKLSKYTHWRKINLE